MPHIEVKNISKCFGSVQALSSMSLSVENGQCLCLFGPSGCGKTTLLRCVAGLERPDTGEVLFDGHEVTGNGLFVPPRERDAGMVFQDFALWPHMRAWRHIDFVLQGWGMGRPDRRGRTEALLDLCGLQERRRARPGEMSGGEQQRLSIARALAPEPSLHLLDEPFAHLDHANRERIAGEILRRKREGGATILLATHNEADVSLLADEVVEMA